MAVFTDLPPELRAQIWHLCLPDPLTSEIYFFEPDEDDDPDEDGSASPGAGPDSESESEWATEREVLTGLPVIMHLCSEARAYAKSHLTFTEVPGLGGLEVPCRPYQPATDVFLVRATDFDALHRAALMGLNAEYRAVERNVPLENRPHIFCRHIAHLAIDAGVYAMSEVPDPEYLIPELTALRKLSLILHRTTRAEQIAVRPGRRYGLLPFTESHGLLVANRQRSRVEIEDFVGGIMDASALWEVAEMAVAPIDQYTSEWLFDTEAVEIVSAPAIV